jgi:TetR/AcrR family transcriptional regulator, transcriptional repressor for nem operon
MARYKDDHWDKTHEAIVAAAASMLRERGFEGTSVVEVMKAVGLTHGGFYAHFPDKTAMLIAALERAFVQSPRNFHMLAGLANARGDAGFVVERYLADVQVSDVPNGCPGAALISEVARQPAAVQVAFEEGARQSARALGETDGLIQGESHPEAWAALAMLMGALSLMRAVPDGPTRDQIRQQAVKGLKRLADSPAD